MHTYWLWPPLAAHLLQATVFAALACLAAVLLRRAPAAARYSVWLMAAVKFAVPAGMLAAAGARIATLFPSAPPPLPPVFAPLVLGYTGRATPDALHSELLCVLTVVWLAGALLCYIRWARQAVACRPVGLRAPDAREAAALERARARLGFRGRVRLAVGGTHEPALWGLWRPVLRVPENLAAHLDEPELEAILMHELVHARRRDNLTAALARAIACLFWFHPLLWWIERLLIDARERACDEAVLRAAAPRAAYAAGILKVCRLSLAAAVPGVSGVAGESNLKKRTEEIMLQPIRKITLAHVLTAGLLAGSMALLPMAAGFADEKPRAQGSQIRSVEPAEALPLLTARPEPSGKPYAEWLDEDVAYIATPEERSEFLRLASDAARERFIERFWQSRGNEFKKEHYRRIAYANARWGSQTDRGRIYIMLGPADEIESWPGVKEKWTYRRWPGAPGRLSITFEL